MKRSTQFLFLLVITIVVSLVSVVSRQRMRTPREILDEVHTTLVKGIYDEQALLRRLDSSLRKAADMDLGEPHPDDIRAEIHITRGRIYLEIGATDKARMDFLTVLEDYRPGNREIRRLLIEAERADGKIEDALGHLEELLADEPSYGPAWVEMGILRQGLAEEALATCDEKLGYALVEEDAARGSLILRRLAARDPSDTRRSTTILDLRELFPPSAEEELGQILSLSQEASVHLAAGRKALIHSFTIELDPRALSHYLKILEAAGQDRETLQLGSLLAVGESTQGVKATAELLIGLLLKREDYVHAAQLATKWVYRDTPLTTSFLRLCCQALFYGKDYPGLSNAASRLRSIGTPEDENSVLFYTGMAMAHAKKLKADRALLMLTSFLRSKSSGPIPSSVALTWKQIAIIHRATKDMVREREALQAALKLDPKNGVLWLRRAEIQRETKHSGYSLPLESWVKGMRYLPTASDSLISTFIELGEQLLDSEEKDVRIIYEGLVRSGRTVPQKHMGPYVLWRIAQMHGESRRYTLQFSAGRRLQQLYPGFIPGLDQMIASRQSLNDKGQFKQLVLQRLEMAGVTETSRKLVSEISLSQYTPSELLDVMQYDPRGTGRLVVADWYHANGESALAIETLEASGRKARSDAERLFGAEVLIASNDAQGALRWLKEIGEGSNHRSEALQLAVTAAIQTGNSNVLLHHVDQLLEAGPLANDEAFQLIEKLLRSNSLEAAFAALAMVNGKSLEDPGPLFLRQFQWHLATGELDQAEEIIERASAFLEESDYLVARLLLDGQRGDWIQSRIDAEALLALDLAADPAVKLWLSLLSGREQEVLLLAKQAQEEQPKVTRWFVAENIARAQLEEELALPEMFGPRAQKELRAFLLGRGKNVFDPREIAVLLLAAELDQYKPYLAGALLQLSRGGRGILWPQLLHGDLAVQESFPVEASKSYRNVTRVFPQCNRSWDALLEVTVARFGSALHPQVDDILTQRLQAQANNDPEGAAGLLIQSRELKLQGDLSSALRTTLAAVELEPAWFGAQTAKAELCSDLGQWDMAFETWQALVQNTPFPLLPRALQGYIKTLDDAVQMEEPPLPLEELRAELNQIYRSFPGVPACTLALAHLDIKLDPDNPALGLGRAWARLLKLRDRNPEVSLESLERGSTQAWAQFYVDTDPASAEGFLRSELERQPGNLELWRLLGRVQRNLGNYEESRRVLVQTSAMAASKEVHQELAATLVASGAPPQVMERTLNRITRGTGTESMDEQLLYAESLLNDYHLESWAKAIEFLEGIWNDRHQLEETAQQVQVAALYGRALLLRAEPGDPARSAEVLRSMLNSTSQPYQRQEFECLIGIAQSRTGTSRLSE